MHEVPPRHPCVHLVGSNPSRLSERALALCQDPGNELILSVASLWEMQIKSQLGRLSLDAPLRSVIDAQQEANALRLLEIRPDHAYEVGNLPGHHKDPFDRMIIAQARIEGVCLISHDAVMKAYPVEVEW